MRCVRLKSCTSAASASEDQQLLPSSSIAHCVCIRHVSPRFSFISSPTDWILKTTSKNQPNAVLTPYRQAKTRSRKMLPKISPARLNARKLKSKRRSRMKPSIIKLYQSSPIPQSSICWTKQWRVRLPSWPSVERFQSPSKLLLPYHHFASMMDRLLCIVMTTKMVSLGRC